MTKELFLQAILKFFARYLRRPEHYPELSLFVGLAYDVEQQEERTVTPEQAEKVVTALKASGAIDEGGNVTATVKPEEIVLPSELEEARETVVAVMEKPEPVAAASLAGAVYTQTVVEEKEITYDDAKELMEHFQKKDYITRDGKIKDTMKSALKAGTLELPKKYEAARSRFETIIANANRKPPVRDASRDVVVRLNKQVMLSPEFMELWGKIKQKTTYFILEQYYNFASRPSGETQNYRSRCSSY